MYHFKMLSQHTEIASAKTKCKMFLRSWFYILRSEAHREELDEQHLSQYSIVVSQRIGKNRSSSKRNWYWRRYEYRALWKLKKKLSKTQKKISPCVYESENEEGEGKDDDELESPPILTFSAVANVFNVLLSYAIKIIIKDQPN